MGTIKNYGLLVQEYDYDFAVDGGATGVIDLSAKANKSDLPTGAILQRVVTHVVAAVTGTAASASIGTSANNALYMAARDVDGAAALGLGLDQLADYTTLGVLDAANKADVVMSVTGGAITAGKLKVLAEYLNHNV